MVVDTNIYWFDEQIFEDEHVLKQFLADIPDDQNIKGYCLNTDADSKQIVIEKPAGFASLNYFQGDYHLETLLTDMDKGGITQGILKVPGCQEWMSLAMCQRFNDGMADYVKRSNGRLKALAVVPPYFSEEVKVELDRCFEQLHFPGVQIMSHYGESYLDDPIFQAFFAYLNEREATVYVHHNSIPVEHKAIAAYTNLRRSYGRCIDQTTAIGRELFSDFFERFPKIKMIHSMLGGGLFAIQAMLLPHGDKDVRFTTDNRTIEKHLQDNVYFEMSHAQPWGIAALECAIKVYGADHILFGSSYPVRKEWMTKGIEFVKQLTISDEDQQLILGENAHRLYQITK